METTDASWNSTCAPNVDSTATLPNCGKPPKLVWYQVSAERCLWQRYELWYGKNPQGDIAFDEQLKRAIRSQDTKSVNDEDKDKVQRLNASGLETANPCQ